MKAFFPRIHVVFLQKIGKSCSVRLSLVKNEFVCIIISITRSRPTVGITSYLELECFDICLSFIVKSGSDNGLSHTQLSTSLLLFHGLLSIPVKSQSKMQTNVSNPDTRQLTSSCNLVKQKIIYITVGQNLLDPLKGHLLCFFIIILLFLQCVIQLFVHVIVCLMAGLAWPQRTNG